MRNGIAEYGVEVGLKNHRDLVYGRGVINGWEYKPALVYLT